MKTYTIPQKMSGTGTIHDLASDMSDRVVKFAPGCRYAVVLSSYYGGRGYTTHKTAAAAAARSRRMRAWIHDVIDDSGHRYCIDGYDRLSRA